MAAMSRIALMNVRPGTRGQAVQADCSPLHEQLPTEVGGEPRSGASHQTSFRAGDGVRQLCDDAGLWEDVAC